MPVQGLVTVVITPFDAQGYVNEEGLRRNLRFQIQHQVDGITVLGTTGEAPTLLSEEQEKVIKIAVEEVKGKAHLMVGTGSYATTQTIKNTERAQKLGADSALVVTPYYNKPTQEGIFRHFKALSEAVDLPIMVYNIQGRTGQNIQTDTLKRIATLPHISGVKEASGQVSQMSEVIESIGLRHPHFKILSGDDQLTLPLIALGGHGILSVASNLIPGPMRELVHSALKGDFARARALHFQLHPLFKALFIETNPMPVKAAMEFCHLPAGGCRLPLCEMLPHNLSKLQHVIQQLPKEWFS